ncbi:hypothetical protein BJ138DRAFT_1142643 [Hygrophoropsis aurantiaca]|uniref:Uncharacterized protein n=1 Tax=Hygrophoropsis aurantiaca TaxID=72124 RepID=A0ACB8AP34_9AGAM|nr:hypothetical protein BJ138DRAFT_1142643 [Hygrophoropsis aurantiaca]
MAPLNIHGLNVVHTTPSPVPPDSQDPLSAPHFPDFSAHLDLWTNLAFESDEPLIHSKGKRKSSDVLDNNSPTSLEATTHDGHENVISPSTSATSESHASYVANPAPPFDINSLLADFGIDPFLVAPTNPTQPPAQTPTAPSLAQLLALHAAQNGAYPAPPPPAQAATSFQEAAQPPSKRARTHRNSVSSETLDPSNSPSVAESEVGQGDGTATGFSAAEDKRRRNTAASARFRLKKKEREAALERRAKELEDRVSELERECEGLRRENGWLKGLVVGVTGAGASQQQIAAK